MLLVTPVYLVVDCTTLNDDRSPLRALSTVDFYRPEGQITFFLVYQVIGLSFYFLLPKRRSAARLQWSTRLPLNSILVNLELVTRLNSFSWSVATAPLDPTVPVAA